MKIKIAFATAVIALNLVGCGSKDSSNNTAAPAPAVPENLTFTKPAQGRQLTESEIKQLSQAFENRGQLALPPGELIYPRTDLTSSQRQALETELAKKDPNGLKLLRDIDAGCEKGRPSMFMDASFPMNGDINAPNLVKDDHLSWGSSSALVEKNGCPVDYESRTGLAAKVEESTRGKSLTVSGNANVNGKALAIKPEYQKILNARGIILQSNISALATAADTTGRLLITFKLAGTYSRLTMDIPMTMSVQALNVNVSKDNSKSETILSTTVKMPSFDATLDVHEIQQNGKTILVEAFLNGYPLSQPEMVKLFGKQNPAISAQNQIVLPTLN